MLADLKLAFRSLGHAPGFSVAAVLTLALGIGASTAIYSTVSALFIRPLGFADSAQLVRIWATPPDGSSSRNGVAYTRYEQMAREQTVFSSLAAETTSTFAFSDQGGEPEHLTGMRVTANFFRTLGVTPLLGRDFAADEDRPGGAAVAILGHGFWQRRFGSDAQIVGKTITLDGVATTIVGVLPASFGFPYSDSAIWVPRVFELAGMTQLRLDRGAGFLLLLGRLRPGVTPARVADELNVIRTHYIAANPSRIDARFFSASYPFQEDLVGNLRPAFAVLAVAVGLVLFLACANVAGLLLARFAGRRRELAVRAALGATRGRLIRQLLAESLLLALAGGGAGLVFAAWIRDGILALGRDFLPATLPLSLDGPVLGFALGLTLLCGLFAGLAPALQTAGIDLGDALSDAGRGAAGSGHRQRLRSVLVIAQIAFSSLMLIGACLLIESFIALQRQDAGFEPDGLFTADISLPVAKYPTAAARAAFYDRLIGQLETMPGVERAAAIFGLPFSGTTSVTTFLVAGQPVLPPPDRPYVIRRAITADYFATMKIPLRQGRFFTADDDARHPGVAIISESLAHKLFGARNPIGQRLIVGAQNDASDEIVGVVGDIRNSPPGPQQTSGEESYYPLAQRPEVAFSVVLRGKIQPAALAPLLRRAVRAVDETQPVNAAQSMRDRMSQSIADRRGTAWLLGAFAVSALALSALGLYALIAYLVRQRTREIGVRVALGAAPADIFRLVLREGGGLATLGLVIGLLGALGLRRFLATQLVGVDPSDPRIFLGVALLIAAVAFIATLLPARRATRVDPIIALRSD